MDSVQSYDAVHNPEGIHCQVIQVNVIVVKNLPKQAREGETKPPLDNGAERYWDFILKSVICLFVHSWESKKDIIWNLVFGPKNRYVLVSYEEMTMGKAGAGSHFQ